MALKSTSVVTSFVTLIFEHLITLVTKSLSPMNLQRDVRKV